VLGLHGDYELKIFCFDLLTRETCDVPPLSGQGLGLSRIDYVVKDVPLLVSSILVQSWNPIAMGERVAQFYIPRSLQ